MNEWLDDDGYPTETALERIRTAESVCGALDALRDAWNKDYGSFTEELRPEELAVVTLETQDNEERFYRFATGGWSGCEDAIAAFQENFVAHAMSWRMSASGGLHIFEYPDGW